MFSFPFSGQINCYLLYFVGKIRPVDDRSCVVFCVYMCVLVRWAYVKETPVKGPWSSEEDDHLKRLVDEYGAKKW